ncbi:MAG: hypothetical protein WAQ52_14130 [Terriglobales bacterium]
MTKRGKVLRDPNARPGLLMVEGQQHQFALEGVWRSETPPKPGLVVDVELDASGRVQGITVVPDSQLAKEQAEAAMARERHGGGALASSLVAKLGTPNLVAGGVLAVAWFFLTAVSIQVPFPGTLEFTFWQFLGFLNAGNALELLGGRGSPSAGLYGFLAIVALAGPFLHHFWKDKRAVLGALLPLVFMVIVGIAVRSTIQSALVGGNEGPYIEAAKQARDEAMKAVSLGLGTYLSMLASLYFAFTAAKHFRVSKAGEGQELQAAAPRKAA